MSKLHSTTEASMPQQQKHQKTKKKSSKYSLRYVRCF